MLRFNGKSDFWYSFTRLISIHPMLRFNFLVIRVGTKLSEFQYILCYGSTETRKQGKLTRKSFQYILCYGSTVNVSTLWFLYKEFQYILCYGSTPHFHLQILSEFYFNTSYVTVQRIIRNLILNF